MAGSNPDAILDWSVFNQSPATSPLTAPRPLAAVAIPGAASPATTNDLKVDYSAATKLGTPTPIIASRQVVSLPSEATGRRLSARMTRGLDGYLDNMKVGRDALNVPAPVDEVLGGAH